MSEERPVFVVEEGGRATVVTGWRAMLLAAGAMPERPSFYDFPGDPSADWYGEDQRPSKPYTPIGYGVSDGLNALL